MTKVGDVDWNDLLANEDLSTHRENGDGIARFKSHDDPDFIPVPTAFAPLSPLPVLDAKPIHKQAWQSTNTAKRRQMLTLATIAVTGSLFAIGCFVVFTRMVGTKPTVIAQDTTPQQKLPDLNKSDQTKPTNPDETILEPSTPDPVPSETNADPATRPERSDFASPNTPTSTLPASSPLENAPPSPVQPATSLPDLKGEGAGKTTSASDDGDSIASLFALDKFKPMFEKGNANLYISDTNNAPTELNIENAAVYQAQVFHPLPKTVPAWNDVSKLTFASFRKKDISLVRCIDMFGRMSGVGITLDWQSCRVAGIDVAKKISIDAKDKSLAEMMEQIVMENGLEWSLDGNGLPVVSAAKLANEASSKIDWSITGLFPSGAEREGCDALIKLWGYENVCSYGDGRLQWTEQATPVEKANVHASLFELALVQKLDANHPWRKASATPLLFSPSNWRSSLSGLERKIRPNVYAAESRPITDLLMTAAAETKLNLVIDWQSVWGHGLTPKETAAILFAGRTFPQTAKRFITDYALELVPIFEDTVWLTTRESRRGLIRVVTVRIPKNSTIDDLRQSLRILAPVVNERAMFKVVPVPGADDLFFARICTPRIDQLRDPDVVLGLGWPEKE